MKTVLLLEEEGTKGRTVNNADSVWTGLYLDYTPTPGIFERSTRVTNMRPKQYKRRRHCNPNPGRPGYC